MASRPPSYPQSDQYPGDQTSPDGRWFEEEVPPHEIGEPALFEQEPGSRGSSPAADPGHRRMSVGAAVTAAIGAVLANLLDLVDKTAHRYSCIGDAPCPTCSSPSPT